jgi:antitoxin MazE
VVLAKVQKWGNSLAIRIPRAFAEQLGVQQDSEVDLSLDRDRLIMKPIRTKRTLSSRMFISGTQESLTHIEDGALQREVRMNGYGSALSCRESGCVW